MSGHIASRTRFRARRTDEALTPHSRAAIRSLGANAIRPSAMSTARLTRSALVKCSWLSWLLSMTTGVDDVGRLVYSTIAVIPSGPDTLLHRGAGPSAVVTPLVS